MNFQRTAIIFAIIVLIICLILIGMSLAKAQSSQAWPPLIADCPDYWVDLSGNGAKCVNVLNLKTPGLTVGNIPKVDGKIAMNFSIAPYIGSSGACQEYTWADNYSVSWDGLTYGVATNACDVSSNS